VLVFIERPRSTKKENRKPQFERYRRKLFPFSERIEIEEVKRVLSVSSRECYHWRKSINPKTILASRTVCSVAITRKIVKHPIQSRNGHYCPIGDAIFLSAM